MGQRVEQTHIVKEIKELRRRLDRVERAKRMVTETNPQDTSATFVGIVFQTTNIGSKADRQIEMGNKGLHLPAMPLEMVPQAGSGIATVSATFQPIFLATYFQATTDSFRMTVPWVTDAATTGELRVHNNVIGGATSNVATLPAGSSGFVQIAWLHQQPVTTGPFAPQIEARRTGGAGVVTIFPAGAYLVVGYLTNATVAGL